MWAVSGDWGIGYDTGGVVLAGAIGIGASILALELAYRRRSLAATLAGAVVLGLAISAMHYSAMVFTNFAPIEGTTFVAEPNLSSGALAMIVATAAFVICGLFLLMAVPGDTGAAGASTADRTAVAGSPEVAAAVLAGGPAVGPPGMPDDQPAVGGLGGTGRIPYQRDNAIRFLSIDEIAAIRADGHYSRILHAGAESFCPWPISRLEKQLSPSFLRTHRSYIVNLDHVVGFRRESDKGFCLVDDESQIPVSRSHLPQVQRALGFA